MPCDTLTFLRSGVRTAGARRADTRVHSTMSRPPHTQCLGTGTRGTGPGRLFTLFDLVSFYKPFTPARLGPCTSSAATPENALARVRFLVLLP